MGTPKFDVLAQVVVPPTGSATTVYQPPSGRAGVLAGVRVVMKFPQVESAGGYLYGYADHPDMYDARDAGGEALKIFDNNDYFDSNQNYMFYLNSQNGNYYHNTKSIQRQYPDNSFKSTAVRSVFHVLVGNEKVTGDLVLPSLKSHMDIKVPVVSNRYPLRVLNGVFIYSGKIPNREHTIRNHYKRVSHLAVTVFGQEVDQ